MCVCSQNVEDCRNQDDSKSLASTSDFILKILVGHNTTQHNQLGR